VVDEDNSTARAVALWSKTPADAPEDVFVVYRQTDPAYPPLWYGAGSATVRQQSGRWHQEGRGVAQYTSLSPDGSWAELIRYESIRDENRRVEERRRLWQLQVAGQRLADLCSFDRYLACDLAPELAVGPHADCWPLADDLVAEGFDGILSPSAALDVPNAINLTLFGERIESRVSGGMPDPAANPNPHLWLPTIQVTDAGAPPAAVMHNTCYRVGHHRTFGQWCKQRGYTPGP
jgi:RES domain-containing protein